MMRLSKIFHCLQFNLRAVLNNRKRKHLRSQATNYILSIEMENKERNQKRDKEWHELISTVEAITVSASRKDVDRAVSALVLALAQAGPHDIEHVRNAVDLLARHPESFNAVVAYYESTPPDDISIRQLCLRIIGHLRLPNAIEFAPSNFLHGQV